MAFDDVEEGAEEAADAVQVLEEVLEALPDVLQRSGSAASILAGILGDLSAATEAQSAAEQIAKATGASVADVRRALAEQTRAAAQAENEATKATEQLGAKLESMTGKATEAGGVVGKLQGVLEGLGPEGKAAAEAIGLATIAVSAFAAVTAGMMAKAIEVNENIGLMRARFEALAGGAAAGDQVFNIVQKVGKELPFATAQVGEWAQSLMRAGVASKDLEGATRAVAAAAAINPSGGAEAATEAIAKLSGSGKEAASFLKQVQDEAGKGAKSLRKMGIDIADLGGKAAVAKMSASELAVAIENALQKKGAGPLEAMGNSWSNILQKAKQGLSSVFGGLGPAVEPFMRAVRSLFGEFSKGGVAINILKPIVTSVFSTLFAWATKAITYIHKGFLMAAIAGLKLYIFLRPAIESFKEFVTSANMLRGVAIILALMATPFVVLGAVMLVVLGVIGAIVGVVMALAAAFVYAVGAVAGFVGSIVSAFADAYNAATSAGGSIVDGLVAGLAAGASRFMAAISGLAMQGLDAFKGIFGIKSPSTVMLEHGEENIAGAAATGVDRGASKFDASMAKLNGKPGKGGARGSGGDRVFSPQFTNCTFGAVSKAELWDWLDEWWEEQAAAGPEAEPAA